MFFFVGIVNGGMARVFCPNTEIRRKIILVIYRWDLGIFNHYYCATYCSDLPIPNILLLYQVKSVCSISQASVM